ncbi:MAG: hypothetical protein AAF702_43275 [Chloroflexota bacterium]
MPTYTQANVDFSNRGLATLDNDVNGLYGGTLVITAPVNIGVVDISVQLTSTEGVSTGFVLDSATSHFAQNPAVIASITSGAGDTSNFTIHSEPFVEVIAGQTITRSFSIDGEVLGDGSILTGSYAEIITGYTKEPLRIAGNVLLSKSAVGVAQVPSNPVPATPTPEGPPVGTFNEHIYLPFVNGESGSVPAAEASSKAKQESTQPPALDHKLLLPVINAQ